MIENETKLFTNTGHHYFFWPLAEELQSEEIAAVWGRDSELREEREPWAVWPDTPWVRYRPIRRHDQLGYLVAIETNVGNTKRGIIIEGRSPIEAKSTKSNEHSNSPYAHDHSAVGESVLPNLKIMVPNSKASIGEFVPPKISWQQLNHNVEDNTPIYVDLIVDFGNTRTIALLLEDDSDNNVRFAERISVVRFLPKGFSYEPVLDGSFSDDPCSIVDSWLVLHESNFSNCEPSFSSSSSFSPMLEYHFEEREGGFMRGSSKEAVAVTKRMPQMFIELSPAFMGGGHGLGSSRDVLQNSSLESGSNSFLSSPKRYIWDTAPRHDYWNVEINHWNPEKFEGSKGLPKLQGPLLHLMDSDGRHWEINCPPNEREDPSQCPHADEHPVHPRSDTMTWSALNILETAYRQLNSPEFRKARNPFISRKLRTVIVTFPSGWTGEELSNFQKQWEKAINIFTISNFENRNLVLEGGDKPELKTTIDEAVAAQLPMIYSAVQTMPDGESWIEMIGRGQGTNAIARIMNIDIGGGTTDVSIIDYRDSLAGLLVDLETKLLFKNSNSIAGDALVKKIIECVLLPGISAGFNTQQRKELVQFFRNPPMAWKNKFPAFRQRLARIVRLVLVPIVVNWFKQINQPNGIANPATGEPYTPEEMSTHSGFQVVNLSVMQEFNEMIKNYFNIDQDLLSATQPLPPDKSKIQTCISKVFSDLFKSLAKVMAGFDCDLVFVSGKPTEIAMVQRLLIEHLPVLPNRIIFAHGFDVGDWYPLAGRDGKIHDAKTTTAVGAALWRAMERRLIPNWRLSPEQNNELSTNCYWGIMDSDAPSRFEKEIFLAPNEGNTGTVDVFLDTTQIGRKRFLTPYLEAEPTYILQWKSGFERDDQPRLTIVLKRVGGEGNAESLELVEVTGTDRDGNPVTMDDVQLKLKTLNESSFWMDDPKFDIEW